MRSQWYSFKTPFRRSLQIIMANSLKPLKITAGKFYVLDYERFISVMRASFSYYTLLKNMGEK